MPTCISSPGQGQTPGDAPPPLPALEAFLHPGHLSQLAPAPAGVIQELTEPGHHLLTQRTDGHAPVPHPVPAPPPPAWGRGGDEPSAGDGVTGTRAPPDTAGHCSGRLQGGSGGRAPARARQHQVTSPQEPGRVLASPGRCWELARQRCWIRPLAASQECHKFPLRAWRTRAVTAARGTPLTPRPRARTQGHVSPAPGQGPSWEGVQGTGKRGCPVTFPVPSGETENGAHHRRLSLGTPLLLAQTPVGRRQPPCRHQASGWWLQSQHEPCRATTRSPQWGLGEGTWGSWGWDPPQPPLDPDKGFSSEGSVA